MSNLFRRLSTAEKFIVLCSGLYALVFILMLVVRPGTPKSYKDFQNFYQIIPPLFAGVCHCLYATKTRYFAKTRDIPHFLIGAGCLIWAMGQMTWTYYESICNVSAFPSRADVGYLGSYPVLVVGVLLLFRLTTSVDRARLLIDSGIAASGIGILSWYFLVSARWNQSGQTEIAKWLYVTYPLCDVVLLFVAIVILSSSYANRKNRFSSISLAIGISLVAVGDSLFSYYGLDEGYETGGWFDWAYSFGWLFVAYAALIPLWWERRALARPEEINSGQASTEVSLPAISSHLSQMGRLKALLTIIRLLLPYGIALSAWGIVARHDIHHYLVIRPSTYNAGFWLMFLVISRQVMTMLHNLHLAHRLQVFNFSLEQTVAQRTHQIKSLFELTKAVNNTLQASHVLKSALTYTRKAFYAEAAVIRLCEAGNCTQSASVLEQGLEERPHIIEWVKTSELAQQVERLEMPSEYGGEKTTLLRAPLMWSDIQVGDISVVREGAVEFSEAENEMLESIGLEVAAAYRNAQTHAVAVENADRDSVTGLLNHRAIHERLQTELERAARSKRPLAVIMMDLNNFKLFNDTYGHPVGDQVLKRVATALESKCRKFDVLGRYGGDEFIAILPETDLPLAMVVAQRWRDRMELEGFNFVGDTERTIPVSLSFGIATYPSDSTNRFELVSIADSNLYTAKLSDRGIVATSENQRQNRQLKTESSFDVLDAMVTAVDNKDSYTRRHSEDVTDFALWIAEELGLSQATQRVVRLAGLLHDVGKIGVPESVLKKPGRLTNEEFDVMKQHAQFGAFIVGGVPGMAEILPGVKSHHERFDGRGYPDGLAGEAIPFLGRLLAVADAYSAMTTSRPYRQALDEKSALKEIEANIGTQFDPQMANAFLRAARKRNSDSQEALTPPRLQLVESIPRPEPKTA